MSLEKTLSKIARKAEFFGLDFFDVEFRICPEETMAVLGTYGMPVRFSHWRFGKQYYELKMQQKQGSSCIYELIINSNPCYAFILEKNSRIVNMLVAAHVFAHSDFFKNNKCYSEVNRDVLPVMLQNAEYIYKCGLKYGGERVEKFIDAVLSLQECISPHYRSIKERDVLFFISKKSQCLEDWQRRIITIIREEMHYFWPQLQTKFLNEGWAAFWHTEIMRELDLTESETVEFACLNSAALTPGGLKINPYRFGREILKAVKREKGIEEIFKIRKQCDDLSFIRNYLTAGLIEKMDLFLYKRCGNSWKTIETGPEAIKNQLIKNVENCGFPCVAVKGTDSWGELYLKHHYNGNLLEISDLKKTLQNIYYLWGKCVYIATKLKTGEDVEFYYDGRDNYYRIL